MDTRFLPFSGVSGWPIATALRVRTGALAQPKVASQRRRVMARALRASPQQTIVQLERSAHTLARMRDELQALPVSTRSRWLLERNQKAAAKIAQKLEQTRDKLAGKQPASHTDERGVGARNRA